MVVYKLFKIKPKYPVMVVYKLFKIKPKYPVMVVYKLLKIKPKYSVMVVYKLLPFLLPHFDRPLCRGSDCGSYRGWRGST